MTLLAAHVQVGSTIVDYRSTTLATFNAGLLTASIENVDPRVTALIDQVSLLALICVQIALSDVDIFCLQEVFSSDVQRRIRRDLQPFYPYALSAIDLDTEPSDSTTPACGEDSGLD